MFNGFEQFTLTHECDRFDTDCKECDRLPWGAPGEPYHHIDKELLDGEFEKTVRQYEYSNGCLELKDKSFGMIKYLEIDGRILINEEE